MFDYFGTFINGSPMVTNSFVEGYCMWTSKSLKPTYSNGLALIVL